MVDTNVDLRQQRDVVVGIDEKNRAINAQVDKTGRIVNQMIKKEFWIKFWIIMVIGLMSIVDLFVLLNKLGVL